MKAIKTIIFTLCALLFSAANAQWQPTGNLTFFSDNGKKFYVILNGEKYNEVPETNVRIEELPNPYYSCKIIFEDQTIPTISKNMVMVTDQNGVYHDVTYRIKESSQGKYSIGTFPYSFIPAQQNMARPSGASVYRYGTPRQHYNYNTQSVAVAPATTVVTQPATTIVVTQPQPTMSVNVPGISMSVNAPIIPATTVITQPATTTTVVTNGYSNQPPRGGHNDYRDDRRDDRRSNLLPVGAKVTVNWKGSWYPATVKDVNAATNEYYIQYDGWSESWNEWVGQDRIKGGMAK